MLEFLNLNKKSESGQRFPLFHLKTNGKTLEVTFGPSLAGIVIGLLAMKLAVATTILALFGGSGVFLLGCAVLRRLR